MVRNIRVEVFYTAVLRLHVVMTRNFSIAQAQETSCVIIQDISFLFF